MIHPENKGPMIVQKFNTAIYALRDSGVPEINTIARQSVEMIRNLDMPVVLKNPVYNIPSITGFNLLELPAVGATIYKPIVVINPDKILSSDLKVIQADLIRTLGIANQFPLNGYERRLNTVYDEAIDLQKQWLEIHDAPLQFDPRTMNPEELKRKLMSDVQYYADTGFSDWQQEIEKRKTQMKFPLLDVLKDDKATFLTLREKLTQTHYNAAISTMVKEEYTRRIDRPELNARFLVEIAILNRGNLRLN